MDPITNVFICFLICFMHRWEDFNWNQNWNYLYFQASPSSHSCRPFFTFVTSSAGLVGCRSFFCRPAWAVDCWSSNYWLRGWVFTLGHFVWWWCHWAGIWRRLLSVFWSLQTDSPPQSMIWTPTVNSPGQAIEETSTTNKTCQRCHRTDKRPTGTNTSNWIWRRWSLRLKIISVLLLTITMVKPLGDLQHAVYILTNMKMC